MLRKEMTVLEDGYYAAEIDGDEMKKAVYEAAIEEQARLIEESSRQVEYDENRRILTQVRFLQNADSANGNKH